jgi:hypothetical protein
MNKDEVIFSIDQTYDDIMCNIRGFYGPEITQICDKILEGLHELSNALENVEDEDT